MADDRAVLLLGATGRTGRRVLAELLARGVPVRAIVRSPASLPPGAAASPLLTVVRAGVLDLPEAALQEQVAGCGAVVSCLGHVISLRGVFGPPRDLVLRAIRRVCGAVEALRPAAPVRLVLLGSVSVHRPGPADARRGAWERAFLWALRALVPPAMDNQRAADFLFDRIGPDHPAVRWVVVRPDTLLPGDASPYEVHGGLVNGLFAPGQTRMANAARFMCDLATEPATFAAWRGKAPVIVDAGAAAARRAGAAPRLGGRA